MNIWIDGFKLNDLFYVENVQGVHDMPPSRGIVNSLVTCSNAYYVGTVFEERVITITCCALMDTKTKLLADKMDQIKRVLSPLREKELVFGAYPNRYIKGRIEGNMDLSQIGQVGFFNITFYCADPFYYDKVQKSSVTNVTSFNCKNEGSWTSRKLQAELTVNGTVDIVNQTTGESLRLKSSSPKKVIVDFEKAAIIGGVAENANDLFVSGTFFELEPGDNQITCSTQALFRYRSCYL